METPKEQVQRILEVLPDNVSLEDIQYQIYVRQKVDQGFADGDAARVVSHEEAMRRLDKWRIR
jgi:predicted transcriptional regulator